MSSLQNIRTARVLLIGLAITGLVFASAVAEAIDEGDAAPDFTAPSLIEGKSVSLKKYRGKIVYVDFWASWCPPCLTSLPQFNELTKEFDPKLFQMLAINVDENPDKARRFLAKSPILYPSAMDPKGKLPASFGLETMPTSYLLDRKGRVIYVHKGFRRGDIDRIRSEIKKAIAGGA